MAPITVPFNDLRPRFAADPAGYRAAVECVFVSARYILGPEVEAFEAEFAAYLGIGHAVGVANGTDAIELALRAAGIGPGDEVITVAHTAVATACGIERAGARPVFVDIRADDYTIDPRAIPAAISSRTRAIVAVHLDGQPARLKELRAVADRNNLLCIEDCAQRTGPGTAGGSSGRSGTWRRSASTRPRTSGRSGMAGPSSRRTRPSPIACVGCGTTARRTAIGTKSPADSTAGWTNCRRPFFALACDGWRPTTPSGSGSRTATCPAFAFRRCRVRHPARTMSITCSSCATRIGTRSATGSGAAGSRRWSITRSRFTCSRPTPISGANLATCRRPSGRPAKSCRSRSTRG